MINIQNVYTSYADLIAYFGEEKIKERFHTIYLEIESYFKNLDIEVDYKIDDIILTHAILDYFSDIRRLKEFHNIKNVNPIKIISYESYWLLRRKPIQIYNKDNVDDDKLAFINEKFVFTRIAQYLINNNGRDIDLVNSEKSKVFFNYLDSFYYFLKYRNYDAQMLEIMIMGFKAGVTVSL